MKVYPVLTTVFLIILRFIGVINCKLWVVFLPLFITVAYFLFIIFIDSNIKPKQK